MENFWKIQDDLGENEKLSAYSRKRKPSAGSREFGRSREWKNSNDKKLKVLDDTHKLVPENITKDLSVQTFEKSREEESFLTFFPALDPLCPITVFRENITDLSSHIDYPECETPRKLSLFTSLSNIVTGIVERVGAARKHTNSRIPRIHDLPLALQGPVLRCKENDSIPTISYSENREAVKYSSEIYSKPSSHFIRYIEPSEEDLNDIVEYDMDEQDVCWLKYFNSERLDDNLPEITSDVFEFVMDHLEKQWFHLTKESFKTNLEPLSHEESMCCICRDGEVENSNAIVFCDGCNIAVHQECYGVPYIPEGPWLCRKCLLQPEKQVSCIFCPRKDGAFKQTVTNKWAHLLCAIWIPEAIVVNPVYMEPIDGIDLIPKSRWKLVCSICKKREGACIQCSKTSCFVAYHVTCAQKSGLYMKVRNSHDKEVASFKSYCQRHTPSDNQSRLSTADETKFNFADEKHLTSKRTSLIGQTHPIGPAIFVKMLTQSLDESKITIRQRTKFFLSVCKYWALKRKTRRGAPLLKRLHIEPWTMFSSSIMQNEIIQTKRFNILSRFRNDLESVRTLIDMCQRREKEKLKLLKTEFEITTRKLFPLLCILSRMLQDFRSMDKHGFFELPVSPTEVPDYYEIVKFPMCFNAIEMKIKDFEYNTLDEFECDINLIITNCLMYNKPDTIYAKQILKIRDRKCIIFEKARKSLNLVN